MQQIFVFALYPWIVIELGYRARNHGKWSTELVRDIGEETHVHPVHPLLLFLFLPCAPCLVLFGLDAQKSTQKEQGDGGYQHEVDGIGPPRVPGGGIDFNADGVFGFHDALVVVGDFHMEHILSCR